MNKTLKIYIEEAQKSDLILYLGKPKEEPEYPTLKEYLTGLGYAPENKDSLWDYCIDMGLCELEAEEMKKNGVSPCTRLGNLDERLDAKSDEANSWIETIYSMKESPAAKMKIFLQQEQVQGVSGIHIVEGVQGDGNLHYATADNLEAVKRLEVTLTNMGHSVEVVTVKI